MLESNVPLRTVGEVWQKNNKTKKTKVLPSFASRSIKTRVTCTAPFLFSVLFFFLCDKLSYHQIFDSRAQDKFLLCSASFHERASTDGSGRHCQQGMDETASIFV